MSLKRGVCLCAELQVFSCYTSWKEACQTTRAISTTSRRELSLRFFFPARQVAEGNSRHFDRNIRRTCTIVCYRQKLGRPVKTWWFFPLLYASSLTTTPEIIDQIHELILEDRQISVKSIAEQLSISRERVRSITHEDFDKRNSPRSGSRNTWTRIKNVNGASRLSNFWNFSAGPIQMISCRARLVTMDETWLYPYNPETTQQWMAWYRLTPPQKIPSAKIRWKVLASIFWDQDGIFFIDYLSKGQTINAEYYSSLLVQLKDILKENAAGISPRVSCYCVTMSHLTGHLQSRRNWPTWASNVLLPTLFSGTGPVGLPPVPWTEHTIERSLFFVRRGGHCCRGYLVRRTTFWFFFWVAYKSWSNGLRSVLSFVGSLLNKSWVCSL